jgi:hypothetical protein
MPSPTEIRRQLTEKIIAALKNGIQRRLNHATDRLSGIGAACET